jgi:hypothetical protein
MEVTEFCNVKDDNDEQWAKQFHRMAIIEFGRVMEDKDEHPLNSNQNLGN